jgi:hypothetical protein
MHTYAELKAKEDVQVDTQLSRHIWLQYELGFNSQIAVCVGSFVTFVSQAPTPLLSRLESCSSKNHQVTNRISFICQVRIIK